MSGSLLVMHDSADFGGHERMLLALLPSALPRFDETIVCLSDRNVRLAKDLGKLSPSIRLRPWPFVKQRGEPYLGALRLGYRAAVRRIYDSVRPQTTLLVQGRIENLATPLRAMPRHARLVSYLPMAHSLAAMGRSSIGDVVRRGLYRRPDQFIVPSAAAASQLRAAGAVAPITIVPNIVDARVQPNREVARRELGLAPAARVALLLGRLDIQQKGIDRLAAAWTREAPRGWTLMVVGEGPGQELLAPLAGRAGLDVRMTGWTDSPDCALAAADVLLLPSRWEGVPLVMLEAMAAGVPILAAPIDVFRDYLPAASLHDFETGDLVAALDRVTDRYAVARYHAEAAAVVASHNLEESQRKFADAVAGARA